MEKRKAARLILSLALLFGVSAPARATTLACSELYQTKTDVTSQALHLLQTIVAPPTKFDEAQFRQSLEQIQTALAHRTPVDPSQFTTPESKLALFEASNRHENLNGTSFQNLFLNSTPQMQKKILSKLKKLSFKKGLNSIDGGDALVQIYLLAHATPQSFPFLFERGSLPSLAVKQLIRLRIENQLLRSDLHSALVDLGLLRADQPLSASAARLARYSWGLTWGLVKGILLWDPSFLKLYHMEQTRQEIDQAFAQQIQDDASFEQLYPLLNQKLATQAHVQLVLGSSERFLAHALLTVAWAIVINDLWKISEPFARKVVPQEFNLLDHLLEVPDKKLNEMQRDKLYEDCYNEWRADFISTMGPDIDSSEDAKKFRELIKTKTTRDLQGFAYHHANLY